MSLSESEVEKVARLARLEIAPEQRALYARQLSAILDYAEGLKKVDVAGVEPTAHVLPLRNVLREDEVKPSYPREEMLANAPDKAKGCFRVPKIIE